MEVKNKLQLGLNQKILLENNKFCLIQTEFINSYRFDVLERRGNFLKNIAFYERSKKEFVSFHDREYIRMRILDEISILYKNRIHFSQFVLRWEEMDEAIKQAEEMNENE